MIEGFPELKTRPELVAELAINRRLRSKVSHATGHVLSSGRGAIVYRYSVLTPTGGFTARPPGQSVTRKWRYLVGS